MAIFIIRQLLVWGAAGLTIIISYRLYRRHQRKYLRDWFLFVAVFNFGLYLVDLIKTVFPGLPSPAGIPWRQAEPVFNALLIRPLVFLGLLLFLRFVVELLEIRLHRFWRYGAAFFLLGHVAILSLLTIAGATGVPAQPAILQSISDWLAIAGLYSASGFLMFKTRPGLREPKTTHLRNLGIIFMLCQTIFVFFPADNPPLLAGFFLILPPLLHLWRHIGTLIAEEGPPGGAPPNALTSYLKEFGLTEREREIVLHILRGRDNQRIADELFVSIHTVKHHVTAIFRKLAVRSRMELVNRIGMLERGKENNNPP